MRWLFKEASDMFMAVGWSAVIGGTGEPLFMNMD
jgi:hypothetical protein